MYCIITIVLLIIILFIILKFYANGYIGINKGPCPYCFLFGGVHYHYISPTKYEKKYNERSSGKMCDLCTKYPGQMHMHTHF